MIPMLIGGALSLGGNLYTQYQNKEVGNQMNSLLDQREADLAGIYKADTYRNYLNSDVALSALAKLKTQMKDATAGFAGNAIKRGSTNESNVAMMGELQKRYADAITQMAGHGTQAKQMAKSNYLNSMGGLMGARMGLLGQRQQSLSNTSSNLTTSLGNMASAFYQDGNFWGKQ